MKNAPWPDGSDNDRRLTPRQLRFVEEYLIDLNATQGAIRAGYSPKTANEQGARLLANVNIARAVAEAQKNRSVRTKITQDMVLTELAKIGFSDIRKVVKWQSDLITTEDAEDGDTLVVKTVVTNGVQLISSEEVDDDTAAAISEISQNNTGGIKVKFHDKKGALVDIGKHLGMFKDQHEFSGPNGAPLPAMNFFAAPLPKKDDDAV